MDEARLSTSPSPEPNVREAKPQLRILLAEDNPGDVLLVQEALRFEHLDYELIVQPDGDQMFRYIERIDAGQRPCPDIVLLDLNLPKKDGHTLLARMRRGVLCIHIPVVIVTSSNSPADREAAAQLGISGYFQKPSDFEEFMRLGALIRTVLFKGGLGNQS